MSSLDRDDLRAAVAAGMVTEAQAASILALAQSRRGVRESLDGRDEPFELFKGFNEIFIVVGLAILYAGWQGITGLSAVTSATFSASAALYAGIGIVILTLLARYFTVKRRMVAPSIALTVMVALSSLQFGASLGWSFGANYQVQAAMTFAIATATMAAWYAAFRIPFAVALVALGVFLTAGSLFVLQGAGIPGVRDIFLLSADGPFAVLTVALGVVALAVAMAFDMSDPHRVTRRSAAGFWLHVIAAPAIVNTVALTLLDAESGGAQAILLVFLAALALFAVMVDRRSFLVAGSGYVVVLSVAVLEDTAMLAILALGLGLVLLGAQWERLRGWLMERLPAFPGKSRLPPWAAVGA